MKLWLLTAKEGDALWEPWYDKAFGFVVRAGSEELARAIAAESAGDEKSEAWLNPSHSGCEELTYDGDAGLILRDFAAA